MRLLIRALGSPVPEEVEADPEGTLLDLYERIQGKLSTEVERHRLVGRWSPAVGARGGGGGGTQLDWRGLTSQNGGCSCALCRCTAAGC